jgi:hypothetical protein
MVFMKAISREDIMTKSLAAVERTLMLVAGFLAAAAVANADTLQVRVPFEFVAGKTLLPAGDYQVTVSPDSSRLKVARMNGEHVAFLAGLPARTTGTQATEVQFRKIGNAYVLSRVSEGRRTGWEMPAGFPAQNLSRAARAAIGADSLAELVTVSASGNIVWTSREPRR